MVRPDLHIGRRSGMRATISMVASAETSHSVCTQTRYIYSESVSADFFDPTGFETRMGISDLITTS